MEKLREKHLERWRSEQAAKEFRELDEIGVQLAVDQMADQMTDQINKAMAPAGVSCEKSFQPADAGAGDEFSGAGGRVGWIVKTQSWIRIR